MDYNYIKNLINICLSTIMGILLGCGLYLIIGAIVLSFII